MPGQVIVPPHYVELEGPVIFLAGPIQGAPDWQQEAIWHLHRDMPSCHIASPRRMLAEPPLIYAIQVDWETYYLRRAAQHGVILFWLAKEEIHLCERAYAQTSRFELGEWKVRHERDHIQLVVGIEEGFSNARYLRHRFSQDCLDITIHASLDETCHAAVKILEQI